MRSVNTSNRQQYGSAERIQVVTGTVVGQCSIKRHSDVRAIILRDEYFSKIPSGMALIDVQQDSDLQALAEEIVMHPEDHCVYDEDAPEYAELALVWSMTDIYSNYVIKSKGERNA